MTWKEFEGRNKGMSRTKTLRYLELFERAEGFVKWHDDHDLAPSHGAGGKFFLTSLVRKWLRQKGVSNKDFLKAYAPRRMRASRRRRRSTLVTAAAACPPAPASPLSAVGTGPRSRALLHIGAVLSLTISDSLKLEAIKEIVLTRAPLPKPPIEREGAPS